MEKEIEVIKEVEVVKQIEVEVPVTVIVEKEIEVVKEVEKIVEVERTVLVTAMIEKATPTRFTPTSTPVVLATPSPTPDPIPNSLLIVRPSDIEYTHLQAAGFSLGFDIDVRVGARGRGDVSNAEGITFDYSQYRGLFVTHTPYRNLLTTIHAFAYSGGNAAVLINRCLAEHLQSIVGVTCAEMPDNTSLLMKGEGGIFAPFWEWVEYRWKPISRTHGTIVHWTI